MIVTLFHQRTRWCDAVWMIILWVAVGRSPRDSGALALLPRPSGSRPSSGVSRPSSPSSPSFPSGPNYPSPSFPSDPSWPSWPSPTNPSSPSWPSPTDPTPSNPALIGGTPTYPVNRPTTLGATCNNNLVCSGRENCQNCPRDCDTHRASCGDGVCVPGENCVNCPQDCVGGAGAAGGNATVAHCCDPAKSGCGDARCRSNGARCVETRCEGVRCGDGLCSPTETCETCPRDCAGDRNATVPFCCDPSRNGCTDFRCTSNGKRCEDTLSRRSTTSSSSSRDRFGLATVGAVASGVVLATLVI